jgi:hypothetical protein
VARSFEENLRRAGAPEIPPPPRPEDLLKMLGMAAVSAVPPHARKAVIKAHNLLGSLVAFYADAIADMTAEWEEREKVLVARLQTAERAVLARGDTRTFSSKHLAALEGLLARVQAKDNASVLADAEAEALHFAVFFFGGRTNPRA